MASRLGVTYTARMASSPDELRRWVRSRRAAEERELSEARATVRPPGEALRAALSLVALARARHGWPLPADPHDEEEDMLAYDRWARLRRLARR
jgi:hypothetical protein